MVEIVILSALIFLFGFGAYAVWDSIDVVDDAMPEKFEIYKPAPWDGPTYPDLKAINPEVIGWITIYGTNIDYPLVQGVDNEKYVKTAADGTYSLAGSIFLDWRNKPDLTDFNNLIYGHSVSYNAMFGDISDFLDKEFFAEHRTGDIYVDEKHHGLQILGILETDAYKSDLYRVPVTLEQEKRRYIDEINESAIHVAGEPGLKLWEDFDTGRTDGLGEKVGTIGKYTIGAQDNLAVLSTCTFRMSNGRHILICRITDETYENPYEAEPPRRQKRNFDSVGPANRNTRIVWISMMILSGLVLAATLTNRANRRKEKLLMKQEMSEVRESTALDQDR